MKTARLRLKSDTIAAIEKKSLLRARASTHIKLAYYSFQNFEYDNIKMIANIARKVWLHVGLEFMIIFHNVLILTRIQDFNYVSEYNLQ